MDISQQLAILMQENNIKQGALARALHVHSTTVSNWLKGGEPTSDNLSAIAEYFGVSVEYVEGKTNKKNAPPANAVSAERKKLLDFIQNLPEELDAVAYNVLEAAFQGRLNKKE